MTPIHKADELIERFDKVESEYGILMEDDMAVKCALICVNEIIKVVPYLKKEPWILNTETLEFWKEVKQELEKL